MKIKNLPIFILFLVFLFINLCDIITSFFIQAGEGNPIFTLTNNIYALTFFKILIMLAAFWIYNKNDYETQFSRFLFISILVLATLSITFAVYANMTGILNPAILEEASKVPTNIKTQAYFSFITFMYVIPIIFSLLSFKIYEWSLRFNGENKSKFNTDEWWNKK